MANQFSAYIDEDGVPFEFDVVKEHRHDGELVLTEHPVEDGVDVADHARVQLKHFSCEALISNAPITGRPGAQQSIEIDPPKYEAPLAPTPGAVFGAVGGLISSLFGKPAPQKASVFVVTKEENYVSTGLEYLQRIQDYAVVIKLVTPENEYENMVLTNFSVVRNAEGGTGALVQLEFKQIRIVESKKVNAPVPTEVRGADAKKKGVKGPVPISAEKKDSLAKVIKDGGFEGLAKAVGFK